jgi:hypothetical protein
MVTGSGLGLKRKHKLKKAKSQSKRRRVKDIFTENKKNNKNKSNGMFKTGYTYIFLVRSIQTSIVNSHTVTCKPIAPADNPAQLESNRSEHSDYYIDLTSVRLV